MNFSIIIPCYNEGENIKNLIDKILPVSQKYDVEFILVENGSKDNSRKIFKDEIENKYENIKTVYIDNNKGYGFGIKEGLKYAQGKYAGWIHADMQVDISYLEEFFDFIKNYNNSAPLFLKGKRQNRCLVEHFFTCGQGIVDSVIFCKKLYDIGAVPVIFDRILLEKFDFELIPNDFTIEIFIYYQAKKNGFYEKRIKVILNKRKKGISSWNKGLMSQIKHSLDIIKKSFAIKKGEKIL